MAGEHLVKECSMSNTGGSEAAWMPACRSRGGELRCRGGRALGGQARKERAPAPAPASRGRDGPGVGRVQHVEQGDASSPANVGVALPSAVRALDLVLSAVAVLVERLGKVVATGTEALAVDDVRAGERRVVLPEGVARRSPTWALPSDEETAGAEQHRPKQTRLPHPSTIAGWTGVSSRGRYSGSLSRAIPAPRFQLPGRAKS